MANAAPTANAQRVNNGRAPQRSQVVAARGGKILSSHGRPRVTAKAPSLAAPAYEVAVIPSAWLHQLQGEARKMDQPMRQQSPQREAGVGAPSSLPQAPDALPSMNMQRAPPIAASARPSPRAALERAQPVATRNAGVGTDDEPPKHEAGTVLADAASFVGTLPPPVGAQHVAVGPDESHSVRSDMLLNIPRASAIVHTPRAPDSPHCRGRCDLFGNDKDSAERERERRKLQAQMLAEQIEEQRKRKEDEKRRKLEEDRFEELKLERERREIQRELDEREARERERANANAAANAAIAASAAVETEPQASPTRRPRVPPDMNESPHGSAFQWASSPMGAPSEMSHMSRQYSDRTQRRRRRRRTAADGSTSATWRSADRARGTWDDEFSLRNPDTRHSPTPWGNTGPQADMDVLSTVRESSRGMADTSEARRTRRTRRRRTVSKDRGGRDRERDRERERDRNRGSDDFRPTRDEGTTAWTTSQDDLAEPRAITRPPHPSARRSARNETSGAPEPQAAASDAKLSENDLREQLGSLLRICEQLLRERAEQQNEQQKLHSDLDLNSNAVRSPMSGASGQVHRTPRTGTQRSARRHLSKSTREHPDPHGIPSPELRSARARSQGRNMHSPVAGGHAGGGGAPMSARLHGGPPHQGVHLAGQVASNQGAQRGGRHDHLQGGRSPVPAARDFDPDWHLGGGGGGGAGLSGADAAGAAFGGQPVYESHSLLLAADIDDVWPPDALAGILSDAANVGENVAKLGGRAQAAGVESQSAAPPQISHGRLLESWPSEGLGEVANGFRGDGARRGEVFVSADGNEFNVPHHRLAAGQHAPGAVGGNPNGSGLPGELPPSPFAMASVRGMAVRRQSSSNRRQLMMSPPMSRGGLNVQAHWPTFGDRASPPIAEGDVMPSVAPLHGPAAIAAQPKIGPGHIPIGIRPSIQAQSAMLRELYPFGPQAAGAAGPMPVP